MPQEVSLVEKAISLFNYANFKDELTQLAQVLQQILNDTPDANNTYSSLPSQPYFFGRTEELAFIADALEPASRSWGVLIDGPGGIGKTWLAIRARHLATHFQRRIFLSAKVRQLTPEGEEKLHDCISTNFTVLITDLARELGEDNIANAG